MKDLIYCQRQIPKHKWRYGLRSSAAVGCGWIATYNVLRLLGYTVNIPKLIRYFEWQLPFINGNAGTQFWGPALYFRKWGFPIRLSCFGYQYDRIVRESDACILFYHWREKWKLGAHFVALQYRDGTITGYNTYRNSVGPDAYGTSLEAFLKNKKYFGTFLVGISRKA